MRKNWQKHFFNEIQKVAFPLGPLLTAATVASDMGEKNKEMKEKVQLEPTRKREGELQLPGSMGRNFEGGKRIDEQKLTAENKF